MDEEPFITSFEILAQLSLIYKRQDKKKSCMSWLKSVLKMCVLSKIFRKKTESDDLFIKDCCSLTKHIFAESGPEGCNFSLFVIICTSRYFFIPVKHSIHALLENSEDYFST